MKKLTASDEAMIFDFWRNCYTTGMIFFFFFTRLHILDMRFLFFFLETLMVFSTSREKQIGKKSQCVNFRQLGKNDF